jgi:RimJ/RimL family protein N-acetyltransferase
MRIEPLRAWHLQALELQPSQAMFGAIIQQPDYQNMVIRAGHAFAAVCDDRVLGCGGMTELWENRAQIWALVSKDAGPHMLGIHRAVEGFLKQTTHRRIEAYVLVGFKPGERWLKRLGFEHEGTMRAYSPEGDDYELFARVR